ncbi:MAG TPA: HAMP domain-containing sensor histidine kinase [Candidatus Dormibacteraeota bacterium]
MIDSVRRRIGIAGRIAAAAMAPALVVLAVMAIATWLFARSLFERLMVSHGATAADAAAMFEQSVGRVALIALIIAAAIAGAAAVVLARHFARPVGQLYSAAKRLEAGESGVRVAERPAVPELAVLAEAFDSMAVALDRQEQVRRDFVTGAAHELLTPLTNLEGYLEGLRDGVIPAESATFESLLEETRRLTRLSRALLQTAAAAQLAPGSAVDIAGSIAAAATLLEPAFARREIALDVDVAQALHVVAAADEVTQVVFNLLHNASRYSRAGGVVRITAGESGGMVRVAVINVGEDIPPEVAERVFERFFRADGSRDRSTGGAGVGLAVVKEVVEKAGGRVGVESAQGQTRFWFTLPAAPA